MLGLTSCDYELCKYLFSPADIKEGRNQRKIIKRKRATKITFMPSLVSQCIR
jgi:hypothetical protein